MVAGSTVAASHGRQGAERLDITAALTRAIVVERSLGGGGGGGGIVSESSRPSARLLNLPERMRYCPAAELFVIPADDPRKVRRYLRLRYYRILLFLDTIFFCWIVQQEYKIIDFSWQKWCFFQFFTHLVEIFPST